jgi:hypothetical protein
MIDYLNDENDDLMISGGDFVRGESNRQQQRKLLLAEPGEYKQAPTATVGLAGYLNDDDPSELLRDIRLKFSADGMKVQQLGFVGSELKVIADYGS